MNTDFTKNKTATKHLNVLVKNDNILNQNNKVDMIYKYNTNKGTKLKDSHNEVPNNNLFENFNNLNNKKIIYPNNNYYFKQYKEQYEKHSLNNNLSLHQKIEPGLFGNYSSQLPLSLTQDKQAICHLMKRSQTGLTVFQFFSNR